MKTRFFEKLGTEVKLTDKSRVPKYIPRVSTTDFAVKGKGDLKFLQSQESLKLIQKRQKEVEQLKQKLRDIMGQQPPAGITRVMIKDPDIQNENNLFPPPVK